MKSQDMKDTRENKSQSMRESTKKKIMKHQDTRKKKSMVQKKRSHMVWKKEKMDMKSMKTRSLK